MAMSAGLSIIAQELRRLQREGVERVFIDAATLESISAWAADEPRANRSNQSSSRGSPGSGDSANPGAHTDLRSLIDGPSKTGAAPTAQAVEGAQPAISPASPTSPASPISPATSTLPDAPPEVRLPEGDAVAQLANLKQQVMACPTCNAHLNPQGKIVFGTGNPAADIFFCGEAPGPDEELSGEPFLGQAGQLLDKIISAMGLSREAVYIANILNWRPQHEKPYGNRPPTDDEMRFCLPYLKAQIDIVRPKVIVALGNTAVSGLLGPDPKRRMGSARGTWAAFGGTPLMITFHPSYLLRNGTLKTKRMLWEDMLKVMEQCELPISDRQKGFFLPK